MAESTEPTGDIPINIAHIEDLAVGSMNTWVASLEFHCDRGETQIGSHGEVGDRSDHGDESRDIVEQTMGTRLREGQAEEDEGRHGHDGANGLRGSASSINFPGISERTQYQSEP